MTSDALSFDHPHDEIATLLAMGWLRQRQKESAPSKVLLDLHDAPSMHGEEIKTGEFHA